MSSASTAAPLPQAPPAERQVMAPLILVFGEPVTGPMDTGTTRITEVKPETTDDD